MRRGKKKQLNIFSMSALDLFASALGAFILITLILMPYYEAVTKGSPQKAPPVCPDPGKKSSCPLCPVVEKKICPAPLPPSSDREIKDILLMATLEWTQPVDLDLFIYLPGGGKLYYGRLRLPGDRSRFIYHHFGLKNTPKIEAWKYYRPRAGDYRICALLHYARGYVPQDIYFTARLDKPTGALTTGRVNFAYEGEEKCFFRFNISSDYTFKRL